MKKLYLFTMAMGLGTLLNAQDDVSVSLNNYTAMEATSDDPLDMVFTITNEGAAVIPTGDTIYFAFIVGSSNYSMDLTAGAVSYIKLTSDLAAGATIDLSMLSTPPSTMSMQWIYDETGNLTTNICGFAGVGAGSLSLSPANDANYVDNSMCVSYTVTQVAGMADVLAGKISVYPNPATSAVHFNLAGNDVDYIRVYDISGREVASVQVTGSIESVNTEEFENGVYFYQLLNDEAVVKTDKFSVVK